MFVPWQVLHACTVNHLWNENSLPFYSIIFSPVLFYLYSVLTLTQRECRKLLKTSNYCPIRVIKQHDCCIKWMTVWTVCKYKNIQAYNAGLSAPYRLLIPHMLPIHSRVVQV